MPSPIGINAILLSQGNESRRRGDELSAVTVSVVDMVCSGIADYTEPLQVFAI